MNFRGAFTSKWWSKALPRLYPGSPLEFSNPTFLSHHQLSCVSQSYCPSSSEEQNAWVRMWSKIMALLKGVFFLLKCTIAHHPLMIMRQPTQPYQLRRLILCIILASEQQPSDGYMVDSAYNLLCVNKNNTISNSIFSFLTFSSILMSPKCFGSMPRMREDSTNPDCLLLCQGGW